MSIFPDQVCEAEKDDDNGHALNLKGESPEIISVSKTSSIVSNALVSSTWLQTPAPLNLSPTISLRNTNLYPLSANLCWDISHLWHKQDYLSPISVFYNNIVKGKLSFMQQGWGDYTEETLIFGVLLIAATISNYLEQSGVIWSNFC